MIQRIQSLYLLFATSLMVVACTTPLASFTCDNGLYELYANGLKSSNGEVLNSAIYMLILMVLSTVLPFVNIFLFKKRLLQVRLCIVEVILLIGALIVAGLYYYLSGRSLVDYGIISQGIRIVASLPIAALILNILALRAIWKDERLVRSLDRIR